mgnify:CR=1 FL=1
MAKREKERKGRKIRGKEENRKKGKRKVTGKSRTGTREVDK